MTHSWDNPAKLGHPSQNGTTQPNWDSPPTWDVPHRVGRLNRLGRPMKEWDDPAVGHPTPSPGHTTQAGTSHTNWSIPIFSRLLRRVRERSGTSSNQESCFGSRRRRATNYKNVERRMTARALLAFRRLSLQSETLLEEVETERGAHLSQLRTPRHRAPAPTQLCHSWPEAWLGLATACSTVSCSPCAPGTGVSFRSRIAKRVAHRRRPNAIHADEPAEGGLAARARFHLPPSSAPARFR